MKKRGVTFAPRPSPHPIIGPPAALNQTNEPLTQIQDICTAIHGIHDVKQGLGFLRDEDTYRHRHNIYINNEKTRPPMDPKSLAHLLEISKQRRSGFGLSLRDRLYIAVTLASSVLQLDRTLWLRKQWESGDILFLPIEDVDRRRLEWILRIRMCRK